MNRQTFSTLTATLTAVLALSAPGALAKDPENAIHLTVSSDNRELLTPNFGLEYEHMSGNTSFFLGGSLRNPLPGGRPINAGLDLGIRFYPFAKAPRLFFIGPVVGVNYVNDTSEAFTPAYQGLEGKIAGFRVGAAAGFNLLLGDFFVITVSGGGEYFRDYVVRTDNGQLPTDRQDLGYFLKGGIGFAF